MYVGRIDLYLSVKAMFNVEKKIAFETRDVVNLKLGYLFLHVTHGIKTLISPPYYFKIYHQFD